MASFFASSKLPSDTTIVSWLPFYHDMGLVLGVCAPILGGYHAELTSPVGSWKGRRDGFGRWPRTRTRWSSAPNFAFDLAARKTTDADLAGLDLGVVLGIISGAERVEPTTLHRFVDRFSHFKFKDHMMRPSYGLAEATVFVTSGHLERIRVRGALRCRRARRRPRRTVRARGGFRAGQLRNPAIAVAADRRHRDPS